MYTPLLQDEQSAQLDENRGSKHGQNLQPFKPEENKTDRNDSHQAASKQRQTMSCLFKGDNHINICF